jgi:hypothetical protein
MMLAGVLPTICGLAACSTSSPDLGLDPAITVSCPRTITAPGQLAEREELTLPDGRMVVPLGNAVERENMLVRGALVYREGYRACRSVVIYAEERDEVLNRGR